MTRACVALLALLVSAGAVRADAVRRVALSLDGAPVPVEAGDEIVIEGTVSSLHDGSEVDAFARRTSDLDFVDDGPFVNLPEGSEILHADLAAHRYVVRIGSAGEVSFAVQRLAMRQLLTRSEAASHLRGGFDVALPIDPALEPAIAASQPASTPWWPLGGLVLLAAGITAWWRRRETSPYPRLVARGARALAAVGAEARRLGPAFAPVVESTRSLQEGLRALRDHATAIASAERRIVGEGVEAAAKRAALVEEGRDTLERARALVDRMEGVAAHLAAAVAEHARAGGVDEAMAMLGSDLSIALEADAAAQRISAAV